MFDPVQRRWAALLERLPARLGPVRVWKGGAAPRGEGHMHHVPTLVACLDGVVRIGGTDGDCDLAPGEVLLLQPGVWHRHAPLRGGAVQFGQGFMHGWSDVALSGGQRRWWGRLPIQPSRLLFDRALAAPDAAARRAAVAALLDQVLSEDIRDEDRHPHPAAARMFRAFWSGLHQGISAADLVRASGLGRSQAFAVFARAYGVPPHQAILQARWALAEALLGQGLPPGLVATRCGYPDRRALARARRHAAAT